MELKDRLRALREEQAITPAQLAVEFGKSESAIRMWETGRSKPDADTLIKLAAFFDCTTDYLLGISTGKNLEAHQTYDSKLLRLAEMLSLVDKDTAALLTNLTYEILFGYGYVHRKGQTGYILDICSVIKLICGAYPYAAETLAKIAQATNNEQKEIAYSAITNINTLKTLCSATIDKLFKAATSGLEPYGEITQEELCERAFAALKGE